MPPRVDTKSNFWPPKADTISNPILIVLEGTNEKNVTYNTVRVNKNLKLGTQIGSKIILKN